MSMRGEIISREYQSMTFVDDTDGREYACYVDDIKVFDQNKGLTEEQKSRCTDLSLVLGDTW